MAITMKEVEHVAWLARLDLTGDDKKRFTKQLDQILEHAGNIQGLQLDDVPPTAHALPLENVFREDKQESCLTEEEVLWNAPEAKNSSFVVPRIIADE